MNLDTLLNNVQALLSIDETNLSKESLETSKHYGQMLRWRAEENLRYHKLMGDRKRLAQFKNDYYAGKCDPEVYKEKPFNRRLIKSEVSEFVDSDPEITDLDAKIVVQKEKVDILNDALKMMKDRQFQIKNAIDHYRMLNGGY